MSPWFDLPTHRRWLDGHFLELLDFGRRVVHPRGGAAMLDARGEPDVDAPVRVWVTARMVHIYSLGALLGVPGAATLADRLAEGLAGRLADHEHGGWYSAVGPDDLPAEDGAKSGYDHAFVLLAATSYATAGRPGAAALLERARGTFVDRFWDDAAGMCVDGWNRDWTRLDDYRGINANMHAVEAMLATGDLAGASDRSWHRRAGRIVERLLGLAQAHGWRIPEHFDASWTPLLEYNSDRRDDQFKPYGATVGHGLEWSRLLVQSEATLGADAPVGLVAAAERLFERAVADGWGADGAPGFVYTTDWSGEPVNRSRMHWVVAEAISAAAVMHRRTGGEAYADWYATWWDYAASHLLDSEAGSWHHELDPANAPAERTWPGKPDLYHAVQATLLPRLPIAPSIAAALAEGVSA